MTWRVLDDAPHDVCVRVLSEAFAEEPAVVHLCGPDARRRTAWFDAVVRTHATLRGRRVLVTVDDEPVAVAIATAPGAKPAPAAQLGWVLRTLRGCGLRALVGTLSYLRRTEHWKPQDAWTLEFVGVLPPARGQGLARRLCAWAQEDHPTAPAFLTTADPRNVGLYESWGFSVVVTIVLGGVTVFAMTRPASEPGGTSAPG